jgi:hypothetical protein
VDEWKEKKGISEEDDDVDIYFKVGINDSTINE